jgi:hypothetical protein
MPRRPDTRPEQQHAGGRTELAAGDVASDGVAGAVGVEAWGTHERRRDGRAWAKDVERHLGCQLRELGPDALLDAFEQLEDSVCGQLPGDAESSAARTRGASGR